MKKLLTLFPFVLAYTLKPSRGEYYHIARHQSSSRSLLFFLFVVCFSLHSTILFPTISSSSCFPSLPSESDCLSPFSLLHNNHENAKSYNKLCKFYEYIVYVSCASRTKRSGSTQRCPTWFIRRRSNSSRSVIKIISRMRLSRHHRWIITHLKCRAWTTNPTILDRTPC